MKHTIAAGVFGALLALAANMPATAQSYADGQDLRGTPLDCRASNRTFPVIVRGTGAESRLIARSERSLTDRASQSTPDLTPVQLAFELSAYTPSYLDGRPLPNISGLGIPGEFTFLPLCALALTSDIQGLDSRISALEAGGGLSTGTRLANVELAVDEIARASALAGVLDIAMPTNGRSNRLGVTINEGFREDAIGVSYVRVQGPLDIGVAVGFAGGQSSGKASVGFSW